MNDVFNVMPQKLNGIYVLTLTMPLLNLANLPKMFLFSLLRFLADVLYMIAMLHNSNALEVMDRDLDILLKDFQSVMSPKAAKHVVRLIFLPF